MKDTIIQGFQQAYQNMVQMIAEFLPRLLVMLVIVIVGVLVAYAFKYVARMILRVTRLDRLPEEAGASRVLRMAALPSMTEVLSRSVFWVTLVGLHLGWNQRAENRGPTGADRTTAQAVPGNHCGDLDFVPGLDYRELSVARSSLGSGQPRLCFGQDGELVGPFHDLGLAIAMALE